MRSNLQVRKWISMAALGVAAVIAGCSGLGGDDDSAAGGEGRADRIASVRADGLTVSLRDWENTDFSKHSVPFAAACGCLEANSSIGGLGF